MSRIPILTMLSQSVSYRRKTLHSSFSRLTFYSFISRKKLFFDGNEEIRLRSIYQLIYK